MQILKGIQIIDLALLIKDNLIIADTHIGYEEALNKQGILIPRFQFKEIIQRLEATFKALANNRSEGGWRTLSKNIKRKERLSSLKSKSSNNDKKINSNDNKKVDNDSNKKLFNKIIINGDIKHEFGIISETEWRHTLQLLDFLKKYCNEVILIKGNHDKILGPIAKKRDVKVVDNYIIENILITHGNKIPEKLTKIKTIIIAHEHPAISLKEGPRVELFKCFLKGKYKNKNLIVQPSFNLVQEGTDILKEKVLSPLLKQDLSNFKAYVVADKVYNFGKIKKLR
jgi:putative SbcD/Mre11-related phosphoesterase|tara:strand:+ start:656 stop:1507 length:852 start_codon:yes stop_codon:yes gene_type:complete